MAMELSSRTIGAVGGDADIASVGAMLADPARARILLALGHGRSLAASMLAAEAGIAPSTASHHLARLVDAGFVAVEPRGRFRRYALAGPEVGALIEAAAQLAPVHAVRSLREATRAHAIRYARSCYDHLAGRLGIALANALVAEDALRLGDAFTVTDHGAKLLGAIGVEAEPGELARACLDWTESRDHIAGPLGRRVLSRFIDLDWLIRDDKTRAMRLSDAGRLSLPDKLGIELPA